MSLLRKKNNENKKENILVKYIDIPYLECQEEITPATLLIISWAVVSTAVSYQYLKKMKTKKKKKY